MDENRVNQALGIGGHDILAHWNPMRKALIVITWSIAGVFLFAIFGYYFLSWKFSHPPKRPPTMPENSVWIEGPALPFQFQYRGVWLGCRRTVHAEIQCEDSEWNGKTLYRDGYVPYDDPKRPVEDSELHLSIVDWSRVWAGFKGGELIPLVRLENGTVLLPASDYEAARKFLRADASRTPK